MIHFSDDIRNPILQRGPILVIVTLAAAFIAYSFYALDPENAGSVEALPPDSTSLPPLLPDLDELQRDTGAALTIDTTRDIVTGPFGATSAGLTVGERLKRLDSLMLVVPADSLGTLMTRYEELLDSALRIETNAPPRTYAAETKDRTERSNGVSNVEETPLADSRAPESIEKTIRSEPPPSPTTRPVPPPPHSPDLGDIAAEREDGPEIEGGGQSDQDGLSPSSSQPTRPIRQSDATVLNRRSNSGYIRSVPRSQRRSNDNWTSTQQRSNSASAEGSSNDRSNSSANTSTSPISRRSNYSSVAASSAPDNKRQNNGRERKRVASGSPAAGEGHISRKSGKGKRTRKRSTRADRGADVRTTTSSLKRKYIEGLARFRAGDYRRAIEKLTPVARSSQPFRNDARYYLAVAQERTGRLSEAMGNYRSLRKTSGSIGEKSWIAHARLLLRAGKRSEAKRQLLQFTKSRSGSRYAAEAEGMLKGL